MGKRRRSDEVSSRNRSLEEIEQSYWGEPGFDSGLVHRCHALRQVPIGHLTRDDLRCLLGQHIGIEILVPEALSRLCDDPFDDDDMYPGALLNAILRVDSVYWNTHPDQFRRALDIVETMPDCAGPAGVDAEDLAANLNLVALGKFLARRGGCG